MVFEIFENIMMWLGSWMPSGPAALGKAGAAIVLFYFAVFFLVAMFRGKLTIQRRADGNFYLSDLFLNIVQAVKVPLVFVAVGMIPFILTLECIGNPDRQIGIDCNFESDGCQSCEGITVYEGLGIEYGPKRDIHWTASLANAYGNAVLQFQLVVFFGFVLPGLVTGIAWMGYKTCGFFTRRVLGPVGRAGARQAKKVPIRF